LFEESQIAGVFRAHKQLLHNPETEKEYFNDKLKYPGSLRGHNFGNKRKAILN